MTDSTTEKTTAQGSLNKQGSLSPAPDDLQEIPSGKGYSQGRLDAKKQSSISPLTDSSGQSSLSPEKNGRENKKKSGMKIVIVLVAVFLAALFFVFVVYRPVYHAPSSNEAEDANVSTTVPAEEDTVSLDAIVEIPDPVLKKAIQETLGIGSRDITVADALSMKSLALSNKDGTYVTDITGLSAFSNLKELTIYTSKITDISPLGSFTSLTHLTVLNSPITDITPLANLTNLTDLELGCYQISDISPLSNLTNLTVLNLMCDQVNDFSPLTNLTNLTSLTLVGCHVNDLTPFAGLTNLTYLNLIANQISDISPLADLTNLTFLALDDNQITDLTPLTNMENLKSLVIKDNLIDDISPLANLPNLSALYIIGNPVTEHLSREEILDIVAGTKKLNYLDYGAKPFEPVTPY